MSKKAATKKSEDTTKGKKSIAQEVVKAAEARKKEADKALKAAEKAKADAAAEAAKTKAQEAKAKRGEMILLAAEEGREATKMVTGDHYLNGLQKALGKDYVISATSLTLAEGVKPTEKSLTKLIAGLAGATEGLRKAEGSTTFALGDAVLIAKEAFPEQADEIVQQAANICGREKHTIIQAARVAEFFSKEDRVEGLTATHHQEAMNYAREKGTDKLKITRPTLHKMLEEAFVVEGVDIKKANGEDIDARKEPISVKAFRERLQEKVGKTPKTSKGSKEVDIDSHLFLYVDSNGGVKFTRGLNLEVCKADECLVIDATDLTVLNAKGAIQFVVTELEVEAPEVEAEVQTEVEPEKPKADKPKAAKTKSSVVPD